MEIETPCPPSVHVKGKIDLTEKERQIFDRLLHVVRHFSIQTQLRVAGGWVRDKLLGQEFHDINIAPDNMLGGEVCEKVNGLFISAGEETKGFSVIQQLKNIIEWKYEIRELAETVARNKLGEPGPINGLPSTEI